MPDQPEFSKLINEADELRTKLLKFNIDFCDEADFKKFVNSEAGSLCHAYNELCITGYFSDGFAKILIPNLEEVNTRVRIITQEHGESKRDRQNLNSLRKIQDVGAEIRVNNRTHFRMFLGKSKTQGFLVLGSFDFNKEGMNEERRDVGIRTRHPDLVEAAYEYFNNVWDDEFDSTPLDEMYPDKRRNKPKPKYLKPSPSIALPENILKELVDSKKDLIAIRMKDNDFYVAGKGVLAGKDVAVYLDKVVDTKPLNVFTTKTDGTWAGVVKIPSETTTDTHYFWSNVLDTKIYHSVEISVL